MAQAYASSHSEPICAINVTPFIDILLVLVIMLILTIPIATNKLPIDLPQGPSGPPGPTHQLAIDQRGSLYWDGGVIGDRQLPGLLASIQSGDATLHMKTDPEARYERFNSVLAVVKHSGITRLGFIGNHPFVD
jgi:biopolymer transport protein ExbD